jgi:Esterase-like activity of phytase
MMRDLAFCLVLAALPFVSPAVAGSVADVLDHVRVPEQSQDGTRINELSGLGWDEDEKLLYAVSDNGFLHTFRLTFANDRIANVDPVFAISIADASRGFFNWNLSDAEGLHIRNGDNGIHGDTELVIAFEDGPALAQFSPKGEFIKEVELPAVLADPSSYSGSNKRLESVSELPGIGLITAPEEHLDGERPGTHSIHAMDGRRWNFQALQATQSSVKALDPLDGGRVLVLQRTRSPETDAPQAHFRIVDINNCVTGALCPVAEVGVSNPESIAGDFEGMTRIGRDKLLIVTDSPDGGDLVLLRLRDDK